ncbi:MAG: cupredoxin domain-containing protein [Gemmatimonadota bacterium]|nr:cupredoxin domain-containing protein [Gemmatimonadota bacterium]
MNPRRVLAALALMTTAATAASAQGVTVTLTEFKVQMSRDSVRAGRVTFQLMNSGATSHQVQVKGPDTDKTSAVINAKQAGSLVLTLKPGEYDIICPMADGSHKIAGMVAKLKVYAPAPAPPAAKKP